MVESSITIEPRSLPTLLEDLDCFERGRRPLSGLQLYYFLEAATPLLEFHTMLRPGPQNRMRSVLAQSYGDHNRLLLLGLKSTAQVTSSGIAVAWSIRQPWTMPG